ncbi:MAG: hypothetical protein K9G24_06810 [Candidatus Nanopelagicales bacterium]|nr:hypothetical protein [Candidatus Nanopelagicales bacterium]MCF8537726.1 hypothetical protein [Candidatus Nanopelagicales bacterium]MCF8542774.1 hypothetical protein [Candidatus Nanopelagicales bacterium]MCF8557874.1 hypothetical protein [Candidatus Nanopelagicales bacterium]
MPQFLVCLWWYRPDCLMHGGTHAFLLGRLVRIREDDISRFVGDWTVAAVAHPAKRSW